MYRLQDEAVCHGTMSSTEIENKTNKKNKAINLIRHNTAEHKTQQKRLSQNILKPFWEMELAQAMCMKGMSITAS